MPNYTSSSGPKRKESMAAAAAAAAAAQKMSSGPADDCSQIDSIIGPYGRYQFMIFLFKILIGASSAFNNLGVSFYAPTNFVSFWCADLEQPQLVLDGGQLNNASLANRPPPLTSYEPNVAAAGWPLNGSATEMATSAASWTIGSVLSDFVYNAERGRRHSSPHWSSDTPRGIRQECSYLSARDNQRHKCTSFKYDTGIWMSTIIDEWDLVCDRSLYISITQSLYMSGFIAAYLLFGYLSDRFGRWRSLLLGAVLEISGGLGCAFSTSVVQFVCFRFLLGLGNAGRSSSSYLIMIEWTGPTWRMQISALGSLGWAFSYCAMPWLAMYYLHFRHLQLYVCLYEFVFVIWLLFLPESPRWLLTRRRFGEARRVLLRAAKFNGLVRERQLDLGPSSCSSSSSSSSESIQMKSAASAFKRLEPPPSGSFARKRLNSISVHNSSSNNNNNNNNNAHNNRQDDQQQAASQSQQVSLPESIVLTPTHEVALEVPVNISDKHKHFERPNGATNAAAASSKLEPYTMDEFEAKFAKLVEVIQQKEFTKNENKLSFIDLIKWRNLRSYTLILAFVWACNSFIYYGIALRVGTLNGTNLFVSFSLAGAIEFPSIFFTLILMKFLPRRLTNMLMFSIILILCLIQVPLRYYNLGWLQQTSMMLAKLFNSCSFTCILYQTMELFPTSMRQTAYSSCALAGRIGSILAPFVKELSQLTNELVPPAVYAVLSLLEILLVRRLPETRGSDMPDTLMEAEKFKGTSTGKQQTRASSNSAR